MAKVKFQMLDMQQKEWFIAALLPHIRGPLMQYNIAMKTEAMELAMKLEDSPIGYGTGGMIQIQSHLDNLTIQLQDIKRGKEVQEDLWCTRCRERGHTKDDFPTYMNYISSGALNPLSNQGLPWCNICQTRGHRDVDCMFL